MQQALNPWELMVGASPVVQVVLVCLLAMSLACWFIIGAKAVRLRQVRRASRRFLDFFWNREHGPHWNPERLEEVYAGLRAFDGSPLAALFRAGYLELARVTDPELSAPLQGAMDNIDRALRKSAGSELTRIEMLLPFLATTGATAPFIGLFGTVWGIMNAFLAIAGERNATLDVVAPGIAEALIATAIGLAAAIPAVMAYNFFVRRIRVLESEIESFASDYTNVIRRHFLNT